MSWAPPTHNHDDDHIVQDGEGYEKDDVDFAKEGEEEDDAKEDKGDKEEVLDGEIDEENHQDREGELDDPEYRALSDALEKVTDEPLRPLGTRESSEPITRPVNLKDREENVHSIRDTQSRFRGFAKSQRRLGGMNR